MTSSSCCAGAGATSRRLPTTSDRDRPPRLHRRGAGRGLEVPDAGRVETEYLGLELIGEGRIAMPLDQLIGNPELPEGVDLPLRITPQGRVGAPHHVIGAE